MKNETLREMRIKNKLTQNQVAKGTHTTITYISLLENGHKNPSDKMKEKLANPYNCKVEDIYLAIKLTNSKMEVR